MPKLSDFVVNQNLFQITATQVAPAGFLGVFGSGLYRTFSSNGSFVVPAGVTRIRVRAVAAGGAGRNAGAGGGGGEYAYGVFTVTPFSTHAVVVGTSTVGSAGGLSSFGSLLTVLGGSYSTGTASAPGGTGGIGGDFRAAGGASGAAAESGGGGAGSQLGVGGNSFAGASGGGGVGGGNTTTRAGGSPFGVDILLPSGNPAGAPDITGGRTVPPAAGNSNLINASIRFPFDGFTGGGGSSSGTTGGDGGIGGGGAYGSSVAGIGGIGGGGGGGSNGIGGIGGGGGGGSSPGLGGKGIVVVEW